jgi:hypothetical protein
MWAEGGTDPTAAETLFSDPPHSRRSLYWPTGVWKKQKYCWIGSMSIHQQDILEKTQQVTAIGAIDTSAICVLGKSDKITGEAVHAISVLAVVPERKYRRLRAHHITSVQSNTELSIPQIQQEQ